MDNEIINSTIARVIVSTATKKRQFSLFDIAEDIKYLKKENGGMKKVSQVIGISAGMLNQFLSIYKLPEEIIELVKSRKIDSVSIVHHLSKFKKEEAIELSNLIINDGLSSQDLRILLPYRKQFPHKSINELVKKINDSKNIKVSVIRFSSSDLKKSITSLKDSIVSLVGKENFLTIDNYDNYIDLKITALGEKTLREIVKTQHQTFQELISQLIK
jgi:hypothetical protein